VNPVQTLISRVARSTEAVACRWREVKPGPASFAIATSPGFLRRGTSSVLGYRSGDGPQPWDVSRRGTDFPHAHPRRQPEVPDENQHARHRWLLGLSPSSRVGGSTKGHGPGPGQLNRPSVRPTGRLVTIRGTRPSQPGSCRWRSRASGQIPTSACGTAGRGRPRPVGSGSMDVLP